MTVTRQRSLLVLPLLLVFAIPCAAQAPPEIKAKLDAKIKQLASLSTDPEIVDAVKAHNAATPSADASGMTNERWHSLSVLDPFVRATAKTALSDYLKTKKSADDAIAKIFVSGANGSKVGFDAKTEHWTHKGMPKHEVPMTGEIFRYGESR
jgi:hypothetical protein